MAQIHAITGVGYREQYPRVTTPPTSKLPEEQYPACGHQYHSYAIVQPGTFPKGGYGYGT